MKAKAKLEATLDERDQSISTLRQLAVEKENVVKQRRGEEEAQLGVVDQEKLNDNEILKPEVAKKPAFDYASMPLEKLKIVERARDATLSFLLKRIDNAEAELAQFGDKGED